MKSWILWLSWIFGYSSGCLRTTDLFIVILLLLFDYFPFLLRITPCVERCMYGLRWCSRVLQIRSGRPRWVSVCFGLLRTHPYGSFFFPFLLPGGVILHISGQGGFGDFLSHIVLVFHQHLGSLCICRPDLYIEGKMMVFLWGSLIPHLKSFVLTYGTSSLLSSMVVVYILESYIRLIGLFGWRGVKKSVRRKTIDCDKSFVIPLFIFIIAQFWVVPTKVRKSYGGSTKKGENVLYEGKVESVNVLQEVDTFQ